MTPEGKVKEKVKKMLKQHKAYYFMPVQQGFGAPGLDFHGAFKGRAFAVECKAPGKKLTARQKITIMTMEEAGMKVFVIGEYEFDDTLDRGNMNYSGQIELETWLLGLLS